MWTYLHARREEALTRRETFEKTWLGQCFKRGIQREGNLCLPLDTGIPISARMWTSPDDERQVVVALRFVSTRLVFALARRGDHLVPAMEWSCATVTGASEVVPNEIWRITTRQTLNTNGDTFGSQQTRIESFYVLCDTGEVIGHAPSPRNPGSTFGHRVARGRPHFEVFDKPDSSETSLRTDWAKYIEACEQGDPPCLQDMITSADQESYVAGISAFWLRGLDAGDEGGEQEVLKTIARRYVLSCVEPNR